ncbi:acyl-CoA thioesterase [Niveispirillum sp. KHB5.9]|uniref:acyl-CoA thioesterase n=1 Tax=Niveispirillum sp. KHB5.9 TaxID=3400269 RepID=UPI003A83ECBC
METGTTLMETVVSDPADHDGMLFGGNALRLMGNAALAAARRHTNGKVAMTRTDDVCFHQPVAIGQLLELTARVIHTDAASMTILVDGMVQSPAGRRTLAMSGYFQMVAV